MDVEKVSKYQAGSARASGAPVPTHHGALPVVSEGKGDCVKTLLHLVLHFSGPILMSPQAIAHYEQSADYYKGEESNR